MIKDEDIKKTITEINRAREHERGADTVLSVTVFYEHTKPGEYVNHLEEYVMDLGDDNESGDQEFVPYGEVTEDMVRGWIQQLEERRISSIITKMESRLEETLNPPYIREEPLWKLTDTVDS